MLEKNNKKMIQEITNLVNEVKENLSKEINKSIIYVYWNIGRVIVSNENEHNNRLEYGKEVLKELSDELTKYLGKGYSVSNLKYMRIFYKAYPNFDKINQKLSWSHYMELMIIKDIDKRNFYEKDKVALEYALGGLYNNIFASTYTYYIPNKELLITEVEKVLESSE